MFLPGKEKYMNKLVVFTVIMLTCSACIESVDITKDRGAKKTLSVTVASDVSEKNLLTVNAKSTYYLRADGTANGKSSATGPCSSPGRTMSLSTHNSQSFSPGDTIIVCDDGGNFNSTDFVPPSSGLDDNYIIYQAESNQSPVFEKRKFGVDLKNGQDSLKFIGLTFQNAKDRWVQVGRGDQPASDWLWFDQCTFYYAKQYSGFFIEDGNYGKITNCSFRDAPISSIWDNAWHCFQSYCKAPYDSDNENDGCRGDFESSDCSRCCWAETGPADVIQVSLGEVSSRYWIIEGNTFGNSSHASINTHNGIKSLVIRNNIFRNEYHGNIGAADFKNTGNVRAYTLIEGNSVVGAGIKKDNNPSYRDRKWINGQGIGIGPGNYIIARNNTIADSDYGIALLGYKDSDTNENRVYHNTFYNNYLGGFLTGNGEHSVSNNVVINNIFYRDENFINRAMNSSRIKGNVSAWLNYGDCKSCGLIENYFINNLFYPLGDKFYFKNTHTKAKSLAELIRQYPKEWKNTNFEADPQFTAATSYVFNIAEGSPAENRAVFLTAITGVSGRILTVKDANYFYDGWGIPGEVGDMIYNNKNPKSSARITSIDYDNNRITVNNVSGFSVGDQITTINYFGSAPDLGAIETSDSQPSGFVEQDGVACMEAEHLTHLQVGSGAAANSTWTNETSDSEWASGGIYMKAAPDNGINISVGDSGPRMDYTVQFQTAGTYRIWVRMSGPKGASDSVRLGVDGTILTPGGWGVSKTTKNWAWNDRDNSEAIAQFTVSGSEHHTINVWMREDGTLVDKLVVQLTDLPAPVGLGPEESQQ